MTPNVTLTTDMQKAMQSSTGYATDEKVYTTVKQSKYAKEVHAQISSTIVHDLKITDASSNEGESFLMGEDANDMENPSNYLRSIEKGEENLFSKGTNKLIEGVMPYESEEVNVALSERNFSKALSNLINNAIKYGKENEEILIEYNKKYFKIYNTIAEPSKILNKDKLFSPFVSANIDDDSHGLGLYFVKVILNQANYTCEYKIDGNTFIFVINFV